MFPSTFEYHRAASVKDALSMLQRFGDEAKLLSGGHSLLPMMKLRLAQPAHLIDLASVRELGQIGEADGRVTVGALATHQQVETSAVVRGKLGLLAECAAEIGDVQVRNRGTLGGSLAHADPAADYPAAVLALEGELKLEGSSGVRTVKAQDFFVDLMTTAIRPGELLVQASFEAFAPSVGFAYLKHRQPASGFAMVGVAALVALRGANFERVRVGVTGLCAKAFRATAVEKALAGKAADAATIRGAAALVADGAEALSDLHAAADFRAELARVYTRRALEQALARARH